MNSLIEALHAGATVITPNRRLARSLREAHDRERESRGDSVWASADVLPFSAFVERSWAERADAAHEAQPSLLSAEQERALWERIIRASAARQAGGPLLQVAAAARNAQAAWGRLKHWRCASGVLRTYHDEDSSAFRGWARSFERRCRRDGWIDALSAAETLVEPGALGAMALPGSVVLAGFGALTPLQDALVEALRAAGVEMRVAPAAKRAGRATRVAFEDVEQELDAAARWARAILESEPACRVGIVVPDLAASRSRVARIFDSVMHPGAALPGAPRKPRPFNISLGTALARVPVVRDAILALGLTRARVDVRALGQTLRSAYIGDARAEHEERALLDAALRDDGARALRSRTLAQHIESGSRPRAPAFTRRLRAVQVQVSEVRGRHALAVWAAHVARWLQTLGWPGERPLDSDEHQAVEAFHGLLGRLAALAGIEGPVGLERALSLLRRSALESIFQPKSEPVPVQILGVLETAGLEFSHLWMSGFDDEAWPPAPRPNPFLPIELQRRLGIPEASPETVLVRAREHTQRMLASADTVIVSHARGAGEQLRRVSPLVAGLASQTSAELPRSAVDALPALMNANAPALERLHDERAPALSTDDVPQGGVRIFQDQAACPFRAFAAHRLGAVALGVPGAGPDARLRGNMAHRVLELVWREIGTREELVALADEALARVVAAAVEQTLREIAARWPDVLAGGLATLEHRRLVQMALEWLAIEREREPFEVVAPESTRVVELGGLPVRLRPDRIDRIGAGCYFLIDYKTGKPGISAWFGARPDEPQLPVYTVALDALEADGGSVEGAAYGVLRRGAMGFRGLASQTGVAPGVVLPRDARQPDARAAGDWGTAKRAWRETLEALAQGFLTGDARVAPKRPPQTCRYCDIGPLCRVHEHVESPAHEDP